MRFASTTPELSKRSGLALMVWLGTWFALAAPLAALNPERKADSYSIRRWFTEHGLPSNKIRAVTQTRDGYLWLATAQGIARFDGSHFTTFTGTTNPELRGGGFYAVLEAPDGALWFGGDNGLFRWNHGQFDRFTTEHGLAHNYIRALALTRDGAVVACTRTGYSFVRGGRIATPRGIWEQISGVTRAYLERADGTILLGTDAGLWRISGEHIEQLSGTPQLPGRGFNSLLETADGTLWIGYSQGVRAVHPDGKIEEFGAEQGLATPRVAALSFDRDGNLWILTYGSLFRLARGKIETAAYNDQGNIMLIQKIWEGREGGLWLATATGLFQLRDNLSLSIGPAEGLAQTSVFSIFEASDGVWWIGLWNGGVYRYDQSRASQLPAGTGLDQILAFAEAPAGTIWIGSNFGLFRHSGDTLTNLYRADQAAAWQKQLIEHPVAALPGLAHSRVNSIAPDGTGGLWVATDGALYHGNEGNFRAYTEVDGLPGNVFKSVLRARNGDVWATVPPAGVARLHEGQWTSFLCGKELSPIYPRALYEDSSGNIWVTTEGGGLNRYADGQWRTITSRDGLVDDFISGMTEDNLGDFWIACPRGIMRVPRSEFAELFSGRRTALQPRLFGRIDGLPRGETNQQGSPNVWRTRDGRVLFATDGGVAIVEPGQVRRNVLKPPVYIERFLVNGHAADLSRAVSVPPGTNDVQIHYTALSLLAPEMVRFKIRLAPLDPDWVDAAAQRDVRYAKLPPGDYNFQVIASNNDGVWNEQGAALAFTVRPFFHQTRWFLGLLVGAGLGAVGGVYWARARLARRRMAVLAGLVEERTRELNAAKETAEAAEERAARDRARFKFIFDSVPVGISWSVPGDESTHLVNPAHERITGVSAADSVKPGAFATVSHPEDFQRQQALTRQFLAGEIDHYSIEKRYQHPDGEIVWTVLASRMFADSKNATRQAVTTLVDITALKQAQDATLREQARFRFIFESLPVGISWMLSGQPATRIVNPAHLRITGVADGDRRPIEDYLRATHPDDLARQDALHQRLLAGEIDHYDIEKRFIHADGSVHWAALAVHFLRNHATHETQEIRTLVDISERKQAEAELQKAHRKLLETSRQAGMAEVATGVLHNVGNVLNSVNVSATLVTDQVRESRVANLPRITALLAEHVDDLADFLTNDSKGRKIPEYLARLATELTEERRAMTEELGQLVKNIEHIKDIVAMQQTYAKVSGVTENVDLAELVEDALRMDASAMERHGIELVREYSARPTVLIERHKVLQILVNLFHNAKCACDESGRNDKQLKVRISQSDGRVRLEVIDNGVGIAPENLTRIFAHGFTTREQGHGFGLHSGALAAKELGGSLSAQSDGLGRGATFALELPVAPAAPEL